MIGATAGEFVGTVRGFALRCFDLLEIELERLDRISNLRTMFSPKSGLMSIVISLLRVVVVGVVAESVMEKEFPTQIRQRQRARACACAR